MQDLRLRDEADARAQLGELLVQVAAVVEDVAAVGRAVAGEGAQQGRLAGAGRADDRDQGLLRDAEADVVEQDLLGALVLDLDGQVAGREGDRAGVDELLELVADQDEAGVTDGQAVLRPHQLALDGVAVQEDPVVAAEVDDLVAAVGQLAKLGVVAGDLEVGDDDVVVQRAADPDGAHPGGQVADHRRLRAGLLRAAVLRCRGLRAAVLLGEGGRRRGRVPLLVDGRLVRRGLLRRGLRCPGLGGRATGAATGDRVVPGRRGGGGLGGRGLRGHGCGEAQPGAVLAVAEVDDGAGVELRLERAPAPDVRAVGAAVVLQHPTRPVERDGGVLPGDPGVLELEVRLRVAPDGVGPSRLQGPLLPVDVNDELRHCAPAPLSRSPDSAPCGGVMCVIRRGASFQSGARR